MPEFDPNDPYGPGQSPEWYGSADPNAKSLSPEEWRKYKARQRRNYWLGIASVAASSVGLGALGAAASGAGAAGAAGAGGSGAAGAAGAGAAGAGSSGVLASSVPAAGMSTYAVPVTSALGSSAVPAGAAVAAPTIGSTATGTGAAAAGGAAKGGGIPWMSLAQLGVQGGLSLWGSKKASDAEKRAQEIEKAALDRQYAFLEAQEKQRQQEWAAQQALQEKAFLADQEQAKLDRYAKDEDRLTERYRYERREPNRYASYGGLVNLASMVGINPGPYQSGVMPADYLQRNGLKPVTQV